MSRFFWYRCSLILPIDFLEFIKALHWPFSSWLTNSLHPSLHTYVFFHFTSFISLHFSSVLSFSTFILHIHFCFSNFSSLPFFLFLSLYISINLFLFHDCFLLFLLLSLFLPFSISYYINSCFFFLFRFSYPSWIVFPTLKMLMSRSLKSVEIEKGKEWD